MKVLVLSHMYPSTFNEVAGIFVHEQVKKLMTQGCDVEVISPQPFVPFLASKLKPEWQAYSSIPYKDTREGVTAYYPKYLTLSGEGFFVTKGLIMPYIMHKTIKMISAKEINIVHAHLTSFHMGWLAKRISEASNAKLVVTLHGSRSTYPARRMHKFFMKKVLSCADSIIVVSDYLRDSVLKYGVNEKKVAVIGNGTNLEVFHPRNKTAARRHLGLAEDGKLLLNVGSLSPIKGQAELITAFSRVKRQFDCNLRLTIVGTGRLEQELKRKAKEEEVSGSVLFAGSRPHEEIPWWLNAADLFLLPSYNESQGVSLLEALACGRPVVATKVGGIPEVVTSDRYGFLVQPGDISQLSDAIVRALQKDWQESEIAKYGTKFSWEVVAQKLRRLYSTLLE